ncbi:18017_t:CDS:2, partial [Racocetra persica]
TKRIAKMAKYFPELISYLDSMKSYSMCEGHYNWQSSEKTFVDFGTQVDLPDLSEKTFVDFGIQIDLLEKIFVNFGAQVDLAKKTCIDFGSQALFSDPICKILQRRIDELEENNKQLLSKNE